MPDRRLFFRVPATGASVPAARHHVVRQLAAWGPWISEQVRDAVEVLVSELVTNAILHGSAAESPVNVRVTVVERVLRIEVFDRSDQAPVPGRHDPDRHTEEETGRGMHLVAALADRHGHRMLARGKCVWAELDLPPLPSSLARREVLRDADRAFRPVRRLPDRRPSTGLRAFV